MRLHSLLASASPIVLVAIGLTGCVAGEDEDGIDDSFTGNGKADAFGVAEGSPDAIGVLSIVNNATEEQLHNDALLSANTVKAIIHHRQGGDRMDFTEDDDLIQTLSELDGIPYVGPMAFKLLLDEARAKGAVPSPDPFSDKFCGLDYAITPGQLRAVLGGAESGRLTTTTAGLRVRTRTCVTPDNCPAWVPGTQPKMFELPNSGLPATPAAVNIPAAGVDALIALGFSPDGRPVLYLESMVQVVEGANTRSVPFDLQAYPAQVIPDNSPVMFDAQYLSLDGKLMTMLGTDSGSATRIGSACTQTISRTTDGATQREVVFFARY